MKIKTLALLVLALGAQPAWSHNGEDHSAHQASVDSPALSTRLALRGLWVEHVFWVRNYAVANQQGNAAEAAAAAKEIVVNATAIANSIAPLYGQAAADQLLTLLAGHWGAVKHYSDATVADNAKGKAEAIVELTNNAKALAAFLAKANPNLPEATLVAMLGAHGGHHVMEIDQLSKHDYSGEAQTWQAMRGHMLVLADTLTGALVKQFPEKF
jgi:hypothetical protein